MFSFAAPPARADGGTTTVTRTVCGGSASATSGSGASSTSASGAAAGATDARRDVGGDGGGDGAGGGATTWVEDRTSGGSCTPKVAPAGTPGGTTASNFAPRQRTTIVAPGATPSGQRTSTSAGAVPPDPDPPSGPLARNVSVPDSSASTVGSSSAERRKEPELPRSRASARLATSSVEDGSGRGVGEGWAAAAEAAAATVAAGTIGSAEEERRGSLASSNVRRQWGNGAM